jgi:Cu(I)/Ag(I) efflux system membrane protein CusA/SilA
MIERLIEFSIRNRFIVIIAVAAAAIAGVWVMLRTPVDAIPDLSENQVIVFTDWMGRSPREIEDQITYPLSVNLQGLAGVKAVRSSSEFNFSMINIIFDDSVEFYFARTRVLERLALAATLLPEGVVPYLAPDATALGQIFWYTVEGDNTDAGTLRAIQDWYVRYQLNAIPGVAQVSSVGGFPKEYQIDVTPDRLRAYNITLGDIFRAVENSNSAVGGRVIQKGNAEYLVRGVGWIRSVDDIRDTVVTERDGVPIRVGDVATVQMGSEFRRSVLEKDGREVTGGVVMMRYGENPLEVTRRIEAKIRDLQRGLPQGVRIVPFYNRTRLIEGAIHTVKTVLLHEMLIATLAILLILTHFRSAFVVVITLPLAILASFILMRVFHISSNIMSLSGIAISIGILVDQAIVMVENATHELTKRFGEERIVGDTTEIVVKAARQVGRPIFFSVAIMIVSFLPVFALSGQEGKLFHPLAFTKTFALFGTAILSVTLVPALIPLLIRGRLAREEKNYIVRSFIEMYRPVLTFLMRRPKTVIWLFVLLLGFGFYLARHLGREFMPPLDEGSILDMPITAPRVSVTEAADDLKARDALIRAFPEVEMVVGKAGRADTPTDPSPLDMVESIITLRPKDQWLKRKLRIADASVEAQRAVALLESKNVFAKPLSGTQRKDFIDLVASLATEKFDEAMRLEIFRRQMDFHQLLGDESARFVAQKILDQIDGHNGWAAPFVAEDRAKFIDSFATAERGKFSQTPLFYDIEQAIEAAVARLAADKRLRPDLADPLAPIPSTFGAIIGGIAESFGAERKDFQQKTYAALEALRADRARQWAKRENQALFDVAIAAFESRLFAAIENEAKAKGFWNDQGDPNVVAALRDERAMAFRNETFLWPSSKAQIVQEMDSAVRQLGWANIWTQPIINRVDMLATGVRTQIGVRVFGRSLDDIQSVSNRVANVLRGIPGAVDVVPDQTIGKGYVEIEIDRERAARYGVNVGDVQDVIEIALGGKPITRTIEGRERFPVRLRYARDFREDEESIRDILITSDMAGGMAQVRLADVAEVRIVEGPVMIKSENGLLRSYVQLNVRDRDIVGFVEEAQRAVAREITFPEGSYVEWSGQFEHQVRAKKTLRIVFPAVIVAIFLILYLTYNDFMHAILMMLAVPGALAGGVIFQRILGYNFSVAVWVGYIACFGMATETGIIMLVYLRAAIEERGGLRGILSLEALEQAVVTGAVHRLRPKLLTEGTAIVGLAPMLWAHGVGAEVIAPMAAPVLGGLLIADEVIDIFLPVLFYHVEARRWKRIRALESNPIAGE